MKDAIATAAAAGGQRPPPVAFPTPVPAAGDAAGVGGLAPGATQPTEVLTASDVTYW
jgi:hypothetical protein